MPQDNLRSTLYRSFVTCDDPKGVVECKTIRKSKSTKSKKIEDNIKNQSTEHNSSTSEERKDKFLKGSSYQIMEVSKGAEKLNEVIGSFSNRGSFDHKHIAQDLLRGAIDLQESLEMLGKLQEASNFINKRRNNKEKPEIRVMDFGKPRNNYRCSSRDCFDELRDVITESFARQNMLPKVVSSKREEDFLDANNLDFGMDFASSSTSSSCSWSKVVHEKSKGPNLIAKLMGLEEVPSPKEMNSLMCKGVEKEKHSNGRVHLLNLDLPGARKPQFVVQKVARERRTLEEMIETMQFKGLLERDGENCNCDVSFLRKNLAVEGPPIVIMRPRYVRGLRPEEVHRSYGIKEERNIKSRQKPIKTKMNGNLRVERVSKQKLNKDKEVVKCCGEERRKTNNSKSMAPRVHKKEVVVKKIETMAKEASNTRKQAETKDAESRDVGKLTTLRLNKSGRGSNITPKKNASPEKHMKPTSTLKPIVPKKNLQKGKHESKPSEALVVCIESDDHLPNNNESDVEGSLIKSVASEQITEEVMDASCISISDNSRNEESSPCESSIKEDDIKYIEDGSCISYHSLDTKEACKSLTNTRNLLLSNVSFLNRANELFQCNPTISQAAFPPDIEILDASLLLECAKELLERKKTRCSMMISPLSQNHLFIKPKSSASLEKLVVEICDEFEHLRSYSKSCGGIVLEDSIYPMLERDLLWNGEVTSAWDLGWRNNNGYTVEEVDELVHDVEKLVLTEIVDDMAIEFML